MSSKPKIYISDAPASYGHGIIQFEVNMPVNEYPIKQTIRLSALFKVNEIPADPTQVILFIQEPDDSENYYYYTSGSISRVSTGSYYYDLLPDDSGIWYYRWEGEGVVAADEHQFIVRRSEFYGSHFAT